MRRFASKKGETEAASATEGKEKQAKKKDDLQYFDAKEAEDIAKKLIPDFHPHLKNVPIMYLFNGKKMKPWAQIGARSAKERFISGYFFLMEVNHAQWVLLTDAQREALVDHELCHAGIDSETGEPYLIDHDIEEFSIIVERHGLWREDVKLFGRVCSDQLSLLEKA